MPVTAPGKSKISAPVYRTPLATLAKKLRVARGTVQNRLAKLEADGTVMGYTVRLRRTTSWALTRGELTNYLTETGWHSIEWHEPEESGFFQPLVAVRTT